MATAFISRVMHRSTMMAAAAAMWNPACGLEIQLKIWMGSAVNELSSPVGLNGDELQGAEQQQRRRLADRA